MLPLWFARGSPKVMRKHYFKCFLMWYLTTSLPSLLIQPTLCLGNIIVVHPAWKKRFRISLPCAVFVTLLIYVHHMPVKSFPEQLRNYRVMCTTIFAIVPNVKKSQFSPLLLSSLTNCFTLAKHVGFPSTLMYQGLLSNGMHWMIFCMLPLQTLTLTQISYDFISNCCTLL